MSKPNHSLLSLMPALLLAACAGGPAPGGSSLEGPGPQLVVERFLEAANANDWQVMAQLFGTPDQTIGERDGAMRADRHMQLLASLLRHDDYVVRGREQVPGHRDATNVVVEIVRDGTGVSIPFMVVRRNDGGWIVQQIHRLEDLT